MVRMADTWFDSIGKTYVLYGAPRASNNRLPVSTYPLILNNKHY